MENKELENLIDEAQILKDKIYWIDVQIEAKKLHIKFIEDFTLKHKDLFVLASMELKKQNNE